MAAFWSALDLAANDNDSIGDGEALDRLPPWLNDALQGALDAAVAAVEPLVAARVRARVAEEIARAIEVAAGDRCPDCGGKPASIKWTRGTYQKSGRCGAGHTWQKRSKDWRDPAEIAREHAVVPSANPKDRPAELSAEARRALIGDLERMAENEIASGSSRDVN